MQLELKSILKNKFSILLLIASVLISVSNISLTEYDKNYSKAQFLENKTTYLNYKNSEKLFFQKATGKFSKDYVMAYEQFLSGLEKNGQLYYESASKNWRENLDYEILSNLYFTELVNASNKSYYELNKDKLTKYLRLNELDYNFDNFVKYVKKAGKEKEDSNRTKLLHIVISYYVDEMEENHSLLTVNRPSPFNYLNKTYSSNNYKNLLLVLLILYSFYQIIITRKNKSYDLSFLTNRSKKQTINRYLKTILYAVIILIIIPDLISFIYLGVKNGFDGFNTNMLVYENNFTALNGYDKKGDEEFFIGLTRLFPIALNEKGAMDIYPTSFIKIPLWQFLSLSFILDLLKILLFVSLGVFIALNIKNKILAYNIAFFVSIFAILSSYFNFLPENPLTFESGWNITLGSMKTSYLFCFVSLLLANIIVYFLGNAIFKRREIVG
ncbi:MAG: hypothetical protein Q4B52_05245 [Tissierellia bacterium]|nr:hypothetical protein [Tissierellia bacterium]